MPMTSINDYLRRYGSALGHRVLAQFPPLHAPEDPLADELRQLKRRPFPAQALAIMGIVKRWREARCAAAVAECGTGKTLISLGSMYAHAEGRPFTALAGWDRASAVRSEHVPGWWDAYNAIKHTNEGLRGHATLANATAAVAAVFLLTERIYGYRILQGGEYPVPTTTTGYWVMLNNPRVSELFVRLDYPGA